MQINIVLNRRTVMDALVVIELILLVIYGFALQSISKKLSGSAPKVAQVAQVGGAPTAPGGPAAPPSQVAGKVKAVTTSDYIRGDKKSPLTLIEYSDFECPFCKKFHPQVTQLLQEYQGKVKFVYRHYPISRHQNAQKEAEATECVGELGGADRYFSFHDKIFERTAGNGTGFALADLPKLAAEVGVDQKKFEDCLNSGKYTQKVLTDLDEGTAAGVTGTPATFLLVDKTGTSQIIEGAVPYVQLKQIVDAALSSI